MDELKLAPVYGCGSGMYPQADKTIMKSVLEKESILLVRVCEGSTSTFVRAYEGSTAIFHRDGKRIDRHDLMLSGKDPHRARTSFVALTLMPHEGGSCS